MKHWTLSLGLTITSAALVLGSPGHALAQGRPNLGGGRALPPPPPPPPSISRPPAAPPMNRRPTLFQPGVTPRPPTTGHPPPSQGGGSPAPYYPVPYFYPSPFYTPFYDPFYSGFGYGLFPYTGPYGADDYYNYYRYQNPQYGQEEPRVDNRHGNVTLRVEPRDVDVYVDGVLTARDGHATLNLPTGRWHLEFVHPGYRTQTVDLNVEQGVTYKVERRLQRLEKGEEPAVREAALGDTGRLQVDVQPNDAFVYLDGRAVGMVRLLQDSLALRRLPAGRHVLEVRRPGYTTLRREVVISPVEPAVVRGALREE